MARIRAIEVSNFRSLKEFKWFPSSGINCMIGPGDSGKSTVLDAIDLCLGARRNLQINDADFHCLDTETPITISITIGELDDGLKKIDTYGSFLRGFDAVLQIIEDEPEAGMETVLTLRLTVTNDLEPSWALVSDRAAAAGISRYLTWVDRVRLAPTRVGAVADYNLSWRRGSVLNRLSEEKQTRRRLSQRQQGRQERHSEPTLVRNCRKLSARSLPSRNHLAFPSVRPCKRCWTPIPFRSVAGLFPCTMKVAFRFAVLEQDRRVCLWPVFRAR